MSQTEGYVNSSIENGIATIEFFHPASNSLPGVILNKLAETITEVGNNKKAIVVILKSAGDRAFCAGASFDELIAINDAEGGLQFFSGFAKVINAMRKCPKFIIGRIHGKAVGGGVGLAASVDYAIATEYAAVKLSELAVGIGPFVVGPAVERKMGLSAFSVLATDATEWRSADWAKDHGLYAEVYSNPDKMDEGITMLAAKLAKSSPEAMAELKKVYWQGTDHWDTLLTDRAAISGRLVLSDFTRNAINKFKAKA
ncbi:MAG: enoyl-CoA hydratase/isomerase family protein [Chitinophagaceae bacterium]|nr:enoyl-CoA hydratase/isomerase family protein [Chitinophagaceae bacterium]MCB9047594.1 enoyl-CoA hydratase/isomerase family protein [Chitinophagales bacterium]